MSEIVIRTLKARWFELASKESIGSTPELTEELDELTAEIRKLEAR